MKTTIGVGSSRALALSLLTAAVVATAGCGGNDDEDVQRTAQRPTPPASADYPKAPDKHLARPFTGKPVPRSWFGRWRVADPSGTVDWQILAPTSPECRSITRGRTTCWTVGGPGSSTRVFDVYAGGSITIKDGLVILRMTYRANPNSLACFEDDAYRYRYTPRRIYLLEDEREHCFRELPNDPFRRLTRVE